MKQAVVFLRGVKVGILTEDENGYTFEYDAGYLASAEAEAVSLTLPLSDTPYRDKVLFPFFDGLIPKAKEKWFEFIDLSFLPNEMKEAFKAIIAGKLNLLA